MLGETITSGRDLTRSSPAIWIEEAVVARIRAKPCHAIHGMSSHGDWGCLAAVGASASSCEIARTSSEDQMYGCWRLSERFERCHCGILTPPMDVGAKAAIEISTICEVPASSRRVRLVLDVRGRRS